MKLITVLFFLIFNSILLSLINSVKNNKNQNELKGVEETSKDLTYILNEGAESSVAPQIQISEETLKIKPKVTKKKPTGNNEEEKKLKRKETIRKYYQKNKEKICEDQRNLYLKNKETETFKEKRIQYRKKQYQKNRERSLEYQREYRLKKKNEKEILEKELQFDKEEGNEFDIPQTVKVQLAVRKRHFCKNHLLLPLSLFF
ncbi:unnamed protein product [Meloidogyne enterolobii]|uniref:Uncharacterized protein n=1 Tax=Meloidogyne enterolobii TaxID=390850 RepID=A0ACB0Y6T4_MELEN